MMCCERMWDTGSFGACHMDSYATATAGVLC
jgi:hypothetical protein